ncbi:N-acetylglucosamine-6-phosphate deacetylase [Caminicella sporogenes DSM 14501]|uniref:N-acetylglucosamine-6-phosphate deacetylase n=1 Tax=Caminicella sporogenes DSM 14501 TaxID=1121266 RepID=A0A1M6NZY1_9FIRM|nr:N-acetylglucosamine-6-phosphate deacetylase [Caminicella sporogenes]RKD21583.1 N-acetylglucosamine-6-phosphate deacetylase [Caminicella sporogenes]SHK01220.1 N-acetylglucosamine-6-phosphate deacetylase [Caminicella sporogenes DSM 14501]
MNTVYGLTNGKIILGENVLEDKVLIFKDKILKIADKEDLIEYESIHLIDVNGNYISPGFIDIHIHGAGGSDTMDGTLNSIENISRTLVKTGVTSFLATTMTMSKKVIYGVLDTVRKAVNTDFKGAKVLGAHLEGPFISEKYKGAQNAKYIVRPGYDFVKGYTDIIKIITLAPEMDIEFKFIKKIKETGENIVLSVGHSNATYEECINSIKEGISHGTHIFNAMSPMHHRMPGVVGAVLNSDVTCEIIADKIHVHPAIFQLLLKTKGIDKIILITDSMRAGAMKEGIYELGGQKVIVKDGQARLENNTLAGSVLTMNSAVKNFMEHTDINIQNVIKLATINPARVIGIDDKKGSLHEGKDADIVVFDKNFDIYLTVVEGNILYKK